MRKDTISATKGLVNRLEVLMSRDDAEFFAGLARDVSNACRFSSLPEEVRRGSPNHLPFDPVKPAGLKAYPSVWVQDFTMIFSAGFLPDELGLEHFRLILGAQQGPAEWKLSSGAVVPPWAIADHIDFTGKPIFFPGTYATGPDQGGEPWGLRPPFNNYFDAIWLAHMLVRRRPEGSALLRESIGGLAVYERLRHAFAAPPVDKQGLVRTGPKDRAVGFIFCDSIYMTGKLLMPSLQRCRAARHMRDFAAMLGRIDESEFYAREAVRPLSVLGRTFAHPSGWLRASTGVSSQPDVFGTLYALYTGALDAGRRAKAVAAVIDGLRRGQIGQQGALRHVPLEYNFGPDATWEKSCCANNQYQNGGYWHMPAGWMASVLYDVQPGLARDYMGSYLRHMRDEDFRRSAGMYAPWEWLFGERRSDGCPVFGPSVTLPYLSLIHI